MYDSRKPLWVNVSLLMQQRYGTENLNKLAREAVISPATASRLKAQQTSVGLETIDRLAAYFGVNPHELIRPDQAPSEAPAAPADISPLGLDLARTLDSIKDPIEHQRAYALAIQVIEWGMMSRNLGGGQSPSRAPTATAAEPAQSGVVAPMPAPQQHQ